MLFRGYPPSTVSQGIGTLTSQWQTQHLVADPCFTKVTFGEQKASQEQEYVQLADG